MVLNLLLNIDLKSSLNLEKTKDEQISIIKDDLNKLKEQLKYIPVHTNINRLVLEYKKLINLLKRTTLSEKM